MGSTLESDVRFAATIFEKLRSRDGNVFFSPASIRLAFALLYTGARGRTAEEMRGALFFASPTETSEHFAGVLRQLASRGGVPIRENAPDWERELATSRRVVLHIANRIWPAADRPVLEAFARVALEAYGAPIETLSYTADPEAARTRINAWVEQKTEHKIRDLVPLRPSAPTRSSSSPTRPIFARRGRTPSPKHSLDLDRSTRPSAT